MLFKRFGNKYILRIDRGEKWYQLSRDSASIRHNPGIGDGHRRSKQGDYRSLQHGNKAIPITELTGDFEITSLAGNVTTMNGEVYLHLHATLSDAGIIHLEVI